MLRSEDSQLIYFRSPIKLQNEKPELAFYGHLTVILQCHRDRLNISLLNIKRN